eukprot:TRINITY_DN24953_c0_g1_i2.p1 TRINITY_DN24953_c0_g1~~TRINITY_DN24953_c0_g1_i2.p1  ORF type:complete len:740 (-),score=141.91 TRINITY_DN24953_c0_g1_i2:134-2353(-)
MQKQQAQRWGADDCLGWTTPTKPGDRIPEQLCLATQQGSFMLGLAAEEEDAADVEARQQRVLNWQQSQLHQQYNQTPPSTPPLPQSQRQYQQCMGAATPACGSTCGIPLRQAHTPPHSRGWLQAVDSCVRLSPRTPPTTPPSALLTPGTVGTHEVFPPAPPGAAAAGSIRRLAAPVPVFDEVERGRSPIYGAYNEDEDSSQWRVSLSTAAECSRRDQSAAATATAAPQDAEHVSSSSMRLHSPRNSLSRNPSSSANSLAPAPSQPELVASTTPAGTVSAVSCVAPAAAVHVSPGSSTNAPADVPTGIPTNPPATASGNVSTIVPTAVSGTLPAVAPAASIAASVASLPAVVPPATENPRKSRTSLTHFMASASSAIRPSPAKALLDFAEEEAAENSMARLVHLEQLEHEFNQERLAFTVKVEEEHARLRGEVEAGTAGWRREAESLSAQLTQVRAQLAQTSEAVVWAGRELSNVREELVEWKNNQQAHEAAPAPSTAVATPVGGSGSLDSGNVQRVHQARAELRAAAEAFDSRCLSMELRVEELRELLTGSLAEYNARLDGCYARLADTNAFFSQAVTTVSGDIAVLSQGLGAVEAATGALEESCARDKGELRQLLPPFRQGASSAADDFVLGGVSKRGSGGVGAPISSEKRLSGSASRDVVVPSRAAIATFVGNAKDNSSVVCDSADVAAVVVGDTSPLTPRAVSARSGDVSGGCVCSDGGRHGSSWSNGGGVRVLAK